MKGEKSLHNF